ncbi:hypothetical protein G6F68_020446 [Rhizopus microsporus]|nr:hypothetical protein G6F68_020446 [Rhizopus microsporus]
MAHTAQRWYLVAWDPARDDWRTRRPAGVRLTVDSRGAVCGTGADHSARATGRHGAAAGRIRQPASALGRGALPAAMRRRFAGFHGGLADDAGGGF